ncbi:HIRAN domain-containing protein [Guptibacillus hwajinpoensis]|uniref:HIRAN domain-containing protein n=1 Tax=Guptibacillus hwajinpoensis TaxID=208199 RepID=UPI0024B38320|nr:HIRAN domain-containing protein [Pseudalkalibacillus hwajinpoensis]
MKYINQVDENKKIEFESFIYDCIGKDLISSTVEMDSYINSLKIDRQYLSLFENTMDENNITSYKILEGENLKEPYVHIKYLEQYLRTNSNEKEKFEKIKSEFYNKGLNFSSRSVSYEDLNEFEECDLGDSYSYFILDSEYSEDAKNIVRHVLNLEISINKVDINSPKYGINGLIWFKVPNLYKGRKNHSTYDILCIFMDSKINHCIYNDKGGRMTLDIRMREYDSRKSQVSFRNDLKKVFNSSWEANLARIFNHLGIKWQYEIDSFFIKSDHFSQYYFPDFFLENKTLIEVKGFWDTHSLKKVSLFREQYPDYKLLTIDSDMYFTLDKKYSGVIKEWESGKVNSKKEKVPVVGINRPERKQFVSKIEIGDELFLKRDAENPYDKNAILVMDGNGNSIGFIAKDWASIYSEKLDLGMEFKAVVKEKEAKVIKLELQRLNANNDVVFELLNEIETN